MEKIKYEKMSVEEAFCNICKLKIKYGIFLAFPEDCDIEEFTKSLAWTDYSEAMSIWLQSPYILLLFDKQEDMEHVFENTCGNNNIGRGQFKDATLSVYALTISNIGKKMYENT